MRNQTAYIQANETLLIVIDHGRPGIETIGYEGPFSKDEAAELMIQDGGEFQAIRLNRNDLRDAEDITDEVKVDDGAFGDARLDDHQHRHGHSQYGIERRA